MAYFRVGYPEIRSIWKLRFGSLMAEIIMDSYVLTTLPQMDGYFYFEPDTSDIVTIEPVSVTFRAGTCQREMDCIFVYTRWFDQAKRNMQYTINFKIDRSGLPSVIFTSVMT